MDRSVGGLVCARFRSRGLSAARRTTLWRRGWRRRLGAYTKKPFKKVRFRAVAVAAAGATRTRFWPATRPLASASSSTSGAGPVAASCESVLWASLGFVSSSDVPAQARILEIDRVEKLEGIWLSGRLEPGQLRIEFSLVHRENASEDPVRDRRGHRPAAFAALHHHGDDVLGRIVGREAGEPGDRIALAIGHRLGRTCFARDRDIWQARSAAGPAFVHHTVQGASRLLNLRRPDIETQIAAHLRVLVKLPAAPFSFRIGLPSAPTTLFTSRG